MENMLSSLWDVLADGKFYDWLKSMIETGLKKLSVKINDWLARARRFWDNFAENLKEIIIKAKLAFDMEIRKVSEKMSSVKTEEGLMLFGTITEGKLIQLKHLVGSMVKCMLKLVEISLKNFFYIMKEVAKVTLKRCKEINDNGNKVLKICELLIGFFELLVILGLA
uniref:Uncharacterized protein n=1 Tax=Quercus lobata TaxID=97700 RepID=A0A7N2MTD5_QUELO